MPTKTDTGHVRNVSNLKKLIGVCTSLGDAFKPPMPKLYITALNVLHSKGVQLNTSVQNLKNEYHSNVNARNAQLKGLATFVLSMINIMEICEMSEDDLETARHYYNKIKGIRITPLPEEEEATEETEEEIESEDEEANTDDDGIEDEDMVKERKYHSSTQTSIEYLVEHLRGIIDFAQLHHLHYTPQEEEYQHAGLFIKLTTLEQSVQTANDSFEALTNARIKRNTLMNEKHTGLVDVARQVKLYLRNKYKVNSDLYKKVVPLQFIKINTKKRKSSKKKAKTNKK